MSLHVLWRTIPVVVSLSLVASGCGGSGEQADAPDNNQHAGPVEMNEGPPDTAGDHPTEGPHHGGLIELGDHEYHGELVHDDEAGTVTVYILDSSAKTALPIDAAEVTINLKHDGRPEQFKLAASPDAGDPEGKSSRFVSNDAELAEHLDHEDSGARLMVEINGKPYNGAVEHDHDHADH
jgi:hypothetical protein